jgi:hypothetical protein
LEAVRLTVRGKERHLQVKVRGVFVRRGAADCPLFLIVVRGKHNPQTRREPLPFLVNAQQTDDGSWQLPLPLATLLFWAWQRWEVEVAHRGLKSNFGLGNKQCFNPTAAVASVQWSAWVYAILLLAGYRTFLNPCRRAGGAVHPVGRSTACGALIAPLSGNRMIFIPFSPHSRPTGPKKTCFGWLYATRSLLLPAPDRFPPCWFSSA